jgi:hypothetical protein
MSSWLVINRIRWRVFDEVTDIGLKNGVPTDQISKAALKAMHLFEQRMGSHFSHFSPRKEYIDETHSDKVAKEVVDDIRDKWTSGGRNR